jgi:cytosine permease
MTFGTAVTIVIVSFADSGTMTADFTRWAKNGQSAVYAAFTACPVANMAAQLFGAIIVSADAAASPATSGGDFLPLLTSHGSMLALISSSSSSIWDRSARTASTMGPSDGAGLPEAKCGS